MTKRWTVAFVVVLGSLAAQRGWSQVERVEIRVDGLACPFCAYGLEKKLEDVAGASDIEIRIDDGIVILKAHEGESVAVHRVKPAVRDAGFTAREITATAVGRVARSNARPVFEVGGGDTEFILEESSTVKELQATLQGAEGIRVTGRLEERTPDGHHAHPFTLTLERFEILDSKSE